MPWALRIYCQEITWNECLEEECKSKARVVRKAFIQRVNKNIEMKTDPSWISVK
jgi:hypothetical protein